MLFRVRSSGFSLWILNRLLGRSMLELVTRAFDH